jgi:hypothetical protein
LEQVSIGQVNQKINSRFLLQNNSDPSLVERMPCQENPHPGFIQDKQNGGKKEKNLALEERWFLG